jgi:hypothetical protein
VSAGTLPGCTSVLLYLKPYSPDPLPLIPAPIITGPFSNPDAAGGYSVTLSNPTLQPFTLPDFIGIMKIEAVSAGTPYLKGACGPPPTPVKLVICPAGYVWNGSACVPVAATGTRPVTGSGSSGTTSSNYLAIGAAVAVAGGLAWYLTRKRPPVRPPHGRPGPSKRP